MKDIKLGVSKSRGYENVDLEALRNKKAPQDGEQKEDRKMEVNVKAEVCSEKELKEVVETLKEIEKEHSVNCTLEVSWY